MANNERGNDAEITEPENSTVDDWFGQNVADDQETADEAVAESGGNLEEAERIYERRASGEDKYGKGHPRP